jgi:hypothetical protein
MVMKMKCNLCEKPINDYNSDLNHLTIDEKHSVKICLECIDKFTKWQGKIYSMLFPTKALKRRFGGKNKPASE